MLELSSRTVTWAALLKKTKHRVTPESHFLDFDKSLNKLLTANHVARGHLTPCRHPSLIFIISAPSFPFSTVPLSLREKRFDLRVAGLLCHLA